MVATFVSAGLGTTDNQTATGVDRAGDWLAGDLLVMLGTISSDTASFAGFAAPSGWTERLADNAQGASANNNAPLWRLVTRPIVDLGSEPATYTWTHEAGRNTAIVCGAFRGADLANPISLAGASAATAQSVTQIAPTRTLADNDVMWLTLFALQFFTAAADSTFSTPSGMSAVGQVSGPFNFAAMFRELRPSGATGTRTSTASNAATDGRTGSIGIRSAVAPMPRRRGPNYRR